MNCTLTGFPLKKGFTDQLKKALETDETVTLVLLDIDGFARYNDKAGHEGGDRLLAKVAGVLDGERPRMGFIPGRVGGDEFALLMPGVTLERGFLVAEELRRMLNEAIAREFAGESGLGFSLGVANFPRDAKEFDSLMHKADHALYQAKENGRNQVALPASDEMVLRSCYYSTSQLGRLKKLAESLKRKESVLLREALDDVLRKYDKRPDA